VSTIINRSSLSDVVYECLSDEIMHGKIADGAELNQVQLATRFGVSRIPVREALRRLQAESLVIATPHHSFVVRKVTREQVLELVDIRAALEDLALARRGPLPAELISQLRALNEQMAKGGEGNFLAWDRDFHSLILGPDTITVEILGDVRRKVHKYMSVMVAGKTRRTTATQEHTKIIDALEAQDMDQARVLVHEHVMRSRDFVASRLAQESQ
jgi:DNA-binding GntR family transcriptional regulator